MDSQYVNRTLGLCLSQGLAELIENRPRDPVHFLALWILKYKENQENQERKSSSRRQLEEEQRRLHEETLHQKLLEDEENRIRAAEQLQVAPEQQAEPESPRPPDQGEDQQIDAVDQTETDPPAEDQSDPSHHSQSQRFTEEKEINLGVFPQRGGGIVENQMRTGPLSS
ncbi:DPY30 domain-containing protein 1-like [Puntigrus tetrazona]|uniref:DPY30 domain-containing protein 1-like n=1 Tax=Puntigrus tetrazona TaxID=1606681 RepID=UPI001C899458|nr:DPY30 domain-containing protein 1-like [Puntigrus tetrazona]